MNRLVPTIGRIVLYTLSKEDASKINTRHKDDQSRADGSQVHTGNVVAEGDVLPMIIARAWGTTPDSSVNGQVMLDGNDTLWVTSVSFGEGPRHFTWPEWV